MNVLIIGAGPSGIVAAKEAIDAGLEPLVLEKQSAIGGVWHETCGSAWPSMSTNLSKYSCMFSDFPWPFKANTFPSQQEMLRYLNAYIQHFNLAPYLHFNTTVQETNQREDGTWDVIYTEDLTNTCHHQNIPYVVVASGIFSKPSFPSHIDPTNPFVTHSKHYKSNIPYEGKVVAIVGGSFTGCEIAAHVAQTATKVIHVVSSPHWILNKYINDMPIDFAFYTRRSRDQSAKTAEGLSSEDAKKTRNASVNRYFRTICEPQLEKGLLPNNDGEQPAFVAISSEYRNVLNQEKLELKIGVRVNAVAAQEIHLSDGSVITADNIIFCTGYQSDLNFLSDETKEALAYTPEDLLQPLLLYKCTLHPKIKNMAFVGLYRGPYFSILELQARWSMALFSGRCTAPTDEQFRTGLELEMSIRTSLPRPQFPHGDYIGLSDDIADEIGVKPSLSLIKETNPALYALLYNNPVVPSHYRFFGLNSRAEIAKTVLDEVDHLMRPA